MKPQYRPSQWIRRLRALGWKKIVKGIVGVFLILVGLFALFTPLSPGSWLILVGLEFLGLRILLQDKLLAWARSKPDSQRARLLCRLMLVWERDPARKRLWRRVCPRRGEPASSCGPSKPDESRP